MGYFDKMTNTAFKKDASGNTLFHPWGIFGAGHIIESEEQREKIHAKWQRQQIISILGAPAFFVTYFAFFAHYDYGLLWAALCVFVPFEVYRQFVIRTITKNLAKTNKKLHISEMSADMAKKYSMPTIISFEIIWVFLISLMFWRIFADGISIGAIFIVAAFFFLIIIFGLMIRLKIRQRRESPISMDFGWIAIAAAFGVAWLVALIFIFTITVLLWLFSLAFWKHGGWIGPLISVVAVVVIYGGLGVLISAALTLCGRWVKREDAAVFFDGTFVRIGFLWPCAVVGLLMVYISLNRLLSETDVMGSDLTFEIGPLTIALLSSASFAAGLWNPHWRRKLNKIS